MAITVIGGLAVSTILTLVVIPIMYNLLDRKSDASYRERGRLDELAVARMTKAYEAQPDTEPAHFDPRLWEARGTKKGRKRR